ncbi:LysR family transcriptional regulator [Chitinasiproducens palmae]|uniref:DNA-binding transcriptional regulator, LysR family n=1 Tax=Chitinasiproducens palmae TaxID=1770053 RepID=A0A1H2PM06_9BURK|nr:LysR family transcriptional regulator [Chitinasiproducens palmae]SDV47456.1 DNA-binding transcriptional regulator, LysR family [Chitinasiproducens palmae]
MLPDIPSPLLRSFVAVIDCGSLAAAARRIARSESAVSLQISRLEGILQRPLFDRDGRGLKLNHDGSLLLVHARAILARIDAARAEFGADTEAPVVRLGVVQDFVHAVLRPTLEDIRRGAPDATFAVVIGSTAELLQAISEDRIDLALCAGEPFAGRVVKRLPMAWFGVPALAAADVVPLLSIAPPCPFLRAAQASLDAAGRPWRVALTTPSLDGLRAAVEAGLGIACRTEPGLGLTPLAETGLPPLPDIAYSIVERGASKGAPGLAAQRMAAHLEALDAHPG